MNLEKSLSPCPLSFWLCKVIKDCYLSLLICGRRNVNKLALEVKKTRGKWCHWVNRGGGGDVWGDEPTYRGFEKRDKIPRVREGIRMLSPREMVGLLSESRWLRPEVISPDYGSTIRTLNHKIAKYFSFWIC